MEEESGTRDQSRRPQECRPARQFPIIHTNVLVWQDTATGVKNSGTIRRRFADERETAAELNLPAMAKQLVDHRKAVKQCEKLYETAKQAVCQSRDHFQYQKTLLQHGNARRASLQDKLHESVLDAVDMVRQKESEMRSKEREYIQSVAKQKKDETDLLEMLESSSTHQLSSTSLNASQATFRGKALLKQQHVLHDQLTSKLACVRNNAREALHGLGLQRFEESFEQAKRQVADAKKLVYETETSIQTSCNAFYICLSKDALEQHHQHAAKGVNATPVDAGNETLQKKKKALRTIESEYDKACLKLMTMWKGHDWYMKMFNVKLSQQIAKAIENNKEELERRADDIRAAATLEYLQGWQRQIRNLEEREEDFTKSRRAAVKQRFEERVVDSDIIDVPTYPDTVPSDGETGSMAPQFIELRERRFLEKRPFVEKWIQEDGGQSQLSELSNIEASTLEMTLDRIARWDSLSCREGYPQWRKVLEKHQSRNFEATY